MRFSRSKRSQELRGVNKVTRGVAGLVLCSSGVGAEAFLGARPEALVCESAHVSAVATLAESALTQKHPGGLRAKVMDIRSFRAPKKTVGGICSWFHWGASGKIAFGGRTS
jgi:hypothetical protein